MTYLRIVIFTAALAVAAAAAAQNSPHIGYLYPCGAPKGATVTITGGGQFLAQIDTVYVSGDGVHAKVVEFIKPLNNKQLMELQRLARAIATGKTPPPSDDPEVAVVLNHPWYKTLSTFTPEEIIQTRDRYFGAKKKQQFNPQLGDTLRIEIAVDPDAAPGMREIRLGGRNGITNPVSFHIGTWPQAAENEPFGIERPLPDVLDAPVTLNGQIMPGDVDRFRVRLPQGCPLVVQTFARAMIPYLADAVPGWFQPVLALYDPAGKEVAYADDYRFDPDPVLFYNVPAAGEYTLEIRDSIYRGREDFVYRINVGEQPFVTAMTPLGGETGEKAVAKLDGWNFASRKCHLDTGVTGIHSLDAGASNTLPYAVDPIPQAKEREDNSRRRPQKVSLPVVVNGAIDEPGDEDWFRFTADAGQTVVAEIMARRLNSPLDSVIRITDETGAVVAWNDDCEDKGAGLMTHHADSYVHATIPKSGKYFVCVGNTSDNIGDKCPYRLRLTAPMPDFGLRIAPASINVPAGRSVPVTVYALRKDGFTGAIDLSLVGAPEGFSIDGGRIPEGKDCVRATISAPPLPPGAPVSLRVQGQSDIGGTAVVRDAVPCEDMMQAFAYRHLVPCQQLLAAVTGKGRPFKLRMPETLPVKIAAGGAETILIRLPKIPALNNLQLQLADPPKGVTLQTDVVSEGIALTFKAEPETLKPGFAENIIVEAFTEVARQPKKKAGQQKRFSIGYLPAIPIQVVE